MNERGLRLRFAVGAAVLLAAMLGLGSRLAFLHIWRYNPEIDRSVEKSIIAGRGSIYDRRGRRNIMALNLAVKDVCADPKRIVASTNVDNVARRLADELNLDFTAVRKRLDREDRRFAYVKRFVRRSIADPLEDVPGVFLRDTTVRYYPHGSFMCHVLGFVNFEAKGCAGVEQEFNGYLKGTPGLLEGKVNGLRQEIYWQRDRWVPALKGADVCLTLDQNVQHIVEEALRDTMEEHKAKAAWAIVQRVKTGEILAMASRPAYDLNQFRTSSSHQRLNRAIGQVYEPGSTFKVITLAAAIDEGVVTPGDVFDCENGAWRYANRTLHDYHAYDRLSVADILKKSSNIGAAKIALALGESRFYGYLKAFDLGDRMGIDLPGEEKGLLSHVSGWHKISPTRIAIGQGVAVTALQMLGAVCAVANDGFLMRPYVVDRIARAGGKTLYENEPEILGRPVSYETARTMRRLMARVTEDGGTGRRARVDGYTVAGKTGTAQKAVNGGYSSSAHVASFVGFAPAEDPEIGVIVVVDEPEPLHTGGTVAAPAFQRILEQTLRCLDIEPHSPMLQASRAGTVSTGIRRTQNSEQKERWQ
jgi:cell division protein FtsI (penicillin-binding protein 3)